MDSSGGMKRNTRDFHLVYVRRRKGSGSGKRVSDPNENISFHSESSVPRTDGSREIGHDGRYFVCELCNDGELIRCETCPRIYHIECLDLKSVPTKEWRCPKCCSNEELSEPIKHLKNLDSKKNISSKKGKGGSCWSGPKSKKRSNYAITNN